MTNELSILDCCSELSYLGIMLEARIKLHRQKVSDFWAEIDRNRTNCETLKS
jgi:hypothetical protein